MSKGPLHCPKCRSLSLEVLQRHPDSLLGDSMLRCRECEYVWFSRSWKIPGVPDA